MANPPGQNLLVIERILRDREGVWRQINEQRDLRSLTVQMLTSSAVSLAIFGLVLGASNGFWQALSSMVKLPLLFLATLAICLPTLYLFNLVFGARLSMMQAVTLIMVAITVISVLTLAFAPISLFFLITAQNYEFFKLLNVCILGLTAVVGLLFLTRGMAALNAYHAAELEASWNQAPAAEVAIEAPDRELALVGAGNGNGPFQAAPVAMPSPGRDAAPPAAVRPERPTRMTLVYIWILLFGFVGTQLAWTLRPFFGDPDAPFALFREISGTFYGDILSTIGALFG
jgi:hypothetical protein